MATKSSISSLCLLRVQLEEIRPAIWRELLVPCDTTLDRLHEAIQAAFPWTHSHVHQFEVNSEIIADPAFELEYASTDERTVALSRVASKVGDRFIYEYDLGDGWRHEVRVLEILPPWHGAGTPSVRCVGGARACPPEDCGGAPGYEELLFALAHPNHARHEELFLWVASCRAELASYDVRFKGRFDPEAFDPEAANKAVGKAMLRRRQ